MMQGFWLKWLLATLSGLMLACGFPGNTFPTLSMGWLVPFSLIPLFLALYWPHMAAGSLKAPLGGARRFTGSVGFWPRVSEYRSHLWQSLILTWWTGVVMTSFAFFWVTYPAILFGGIAPLPTYVGFTFYVFLAGFFMVLLCLPVTLHAQQFFRSPHQKQLMVFVPAFASAFVEMICPRLFHWTVGSLMHSLAPVNQWSSFWGFSVGTFFVVLTGSLVAKAWAQHYLGLKKLPQTLGIILGIWVVIFGIGWVRLYQFDYRSEVETTRVLFVQPNYTFSELSSNLSASGEQQQQSLENLIAITEESILNALNDPQKPAHLLVWPESVTPTDFAWNSEMQAQVQKIIDKYNVPILVQAGRWDEEELKTLGPRRAKSYSVSYVMYPGGTQSEEYTKWFPIPFGEMVPLEDVFPAIGPWFRDRVGNTSKLGVGTYFQGLKYQENLKVAPLICFDSILPKLPRLQAGPGQASIFVNQANFVWMGRSNAGDEFAELDRFRGIENGRSMMMVGNTGPTIAFDPMGRALAPKTPLLERKVGYFDLPVSRARTLYSIWGEWPLLAVGGLSFVVLLWHCFGRTKRN